MIVITTPTGAIGRRVLAGLPARGVGPLRALARDASKVDAPGVEVVTGALDDAAQLTAALDGADQLFFVVPPDPTSATLTEHLLRYAGPLTEAIAVSGVRRVVAVSSLGRGVAKDAGQISAIHALDSLVESTGVAYRSLQPPSFLDNLLHQAGPLREQGAFFLTNAPDHRVPWIATGDIAAHAVELLADPTWDDQQDVPLLGAEDRSPNELAQLFGEVLGRPVRYEQIAPEALEERMTARGTSPAWARGITAMARGADAGIYNATPRTAANTTPTTVRAWAQEVLSPAVAAS